METLDENNNKNIWYSLMICYYLAGNNALWLVWAFNSCVVIISQLSTSYTPQVAQMWTQPGGEYQQNCSNPFSMYFLII